MTIQRNDSEAQGTGFDIRLAGKECSMCGDVGFSCQMFQCPKCMYRFQHRYCSSLYPNFRSEKPLCEWCLQEENNNVNASKKVLPTPRCSRNYMVEKFCRKPRLISIAAKEKKHRLPNKPCRPSAHLWNAHDGLKDNPVQAPKMAMDRPKHCHRVGDSINIAGDYNYEKRVYGSSTYNKHKSKASLPKGTLNSEKSQRFATNYDRSCSRVVGDKQRVERSNTSTGSHHVIGNCSGMTRRYKLLADVLQVI